MAGWFVYKHNWFVCSNFVSCSFAEFISSNLFSMHMIMSSASRSNFLFSFSDWDVFYFLSNCTEQNFQHFVEYEWQECLSLLCTRFYFLFIFLYQILKRRLSIYPCPLTTTSLSLILPVGFSLGPLLCWSMIIILLFCGEFFSLNRS